MSDKLNNFSKQIGKILLDNALVLTTAESCTAGLIASILAQTPGSSSWLDSGFIVYSAAAKNKMLGVSFFAIEKYNITSCEVAEQMAIGALNNSANANMSVSTTGVAGPTGGTDEIPVGTVCFAWSFRVGYETHVFSEKKWFDGDRANIREEAALYALSNIDKWHKQIKT